MTEERDIQIVTEALSWAYRNGYTGAKTAAKAFGRLHGMEVGEESLGTYGSALTFRTAAPATD